MIRLDKYLALSGRGTRSEVKELVRKGQISVNGTPVKTADLKIAETDTVTVNGETVRYEEYEYWILYKPAGFLTARTDREKRVVMELVPSFRKELAPVGRLDEDTEGVLLLTDDGALAHELLSPKKHVKKTYYAELDTALPLDAEERLSKPIAFKDFTSEPVDAFEKITDKSAYLTISEGKFHEVKRLFHAIGCDVTYLKRTAFGPLTLDGMKAGEARRLTDEEIRKLKERE